MNTGTGRMAAMRRALGSGPLAVRSFRLLVALPWLVLSTHGGVILLAPCWPAMACRAWR